MFHAFALQGPGNSGKAATLLKLFNNLKKRYPSATIKYIHNNGDDISVIMSDINGRVVGIETRGEPGKRLKNSLNAFVAAKCNTIFCPCRTKGVTVLWIKTLPLQYKIHFVEQKRAESEQTATTVSLMRQAGI